MRDVVFLQLDMFKSTNLDVESKRYVEAKRLYRADYSVAKRVAYA